MLSFDTTSSKFTSVTVASQQIAVTMVTRQVYVFTSSVACYLAQGANPTAAAANGSYYVAADHIIEVDGTAGTKLAVIRVGAADGVCTLSQRRA